MLKSQGFFTVIHSIAQKKETQTKSGLSASIQHYLKKYIYKPIFSNFSKYINTCRYKVLVTRSHLFTIKEKKGKSEWLK